MTFFRMKLGKRGCSMIPIKLLLGMYTSLCLFSREFKINFAHSAADSLLFFDPDDTTF